MDRAFGKAIFAVLYVVCFIGGIEVVNGWKLDMVTMSSIPVLLGAEALVFGMLYATIYHGEVHEESAALPSAQANPRANAIGAHSEKLRAA